ncbi:hypothetical protein BGZ51_001280 [Haplosporangium sp. Z 767]|nr:hypothetical protein BGZ51_001280 [Haplosporangium sp. Z 767]
MPQSMRSDQPYPPSQGYSHGHGHGHGQGQQGQGQGMAPEPGNDSMQQQVIQERNSLRAQNDQLWKLVEKQRVMIQNLQKDVAKVTAERDQLRQSASVAADTPVSLPSSMSASSEQEDHCNGSVQTNGNNHQYQQQHQQQQHQHQQQYTSQRSGERRPQENESLSESMTPMNGERDPEQASGFNPNSSFSSTSSSTEYRSQQHRHHLQQQQQIQQQQQQQQQQYDMQSSRHHGHVHKPQPTGHAYESDFGSKAELDQEEPSTNTNGYEYSNGHQYDQNSYPSPRVTADDAHVRDGYDPDLQMATAASRPLQYNGSQQNLAPSSHHERDPRMQSGRLDPEGSTGSPTITRNVSGNIAIPPHLMPHVPPRSPRRERKDENNDVSDNEEASYLPQQAARRKGPSGLIQGPARARGDYGPEQSMPMSPSSQQYYEPGAQDPQGTSTSKTYMKQGTYESPVAEVDPSQQSSMYMPPTPSSPGPNKLTFPGPPSGGRKQISGQVPMIPINNMAPVEPGPSSPTTMNPGSVPGSPIAAIIDQDAEKFRSYMTKLGAPNRKMMSGSINVASENQDHAIAMGQAVAMENIQSQIEIQNQMQAQAQAQNHGGRGMNQGYAQDQYNSRTHNNPSPPGAEAGLHLGADGSFNPDKMYSQDDLRLGQHGQQLSLPAGDKRRQSSLPVMEGYPKIAARSTSHYRGDDNDLSKEHTMPLPPKRYDSQPNMDHSTSTARSNSPTPSGSSSVTNTLTNSLSSAGHSRSGPTVHQQAFHMFNENLEFVSVLVVGSTIKTNDRGKELLTFTVSIGQEVQGPDGMYPHNEDDELWRTEKQYAEFVNLDSKLRVTQSRNVVNSLPRLPDKSLFSNHAPSKVDARKVALEQYLQQLTSIRIKDTRDLCEFLSTNVVERGSRKESQEGWREGYLTKRGKNFGGWKTRYFMLRGPVLEYFDTKDGHHLGSIALTHAQIGRQQTPDKPQDGNETSLDPNSYRHAFLILEPKKGQSVADAKRNPNSVYRHVLCAETDQERDEWVEALLLYVGKEPTDGAESNNSSINNDKERPGRRMPEIQMVAATPIKDLASVKGNEKLLLNQDAYERQQRSVPPSPSAQHFHLQGRGGGLPQSPTTAVPGGGFDDRSSSERQSAEGQYANNNGMRNNYNQYGEQDQQQQGSRGQPQHMQQQYHGQHQHQQQHQQHQYQSQHAQYQQQHQQQQQQHQQQQHQQQQQQHQQQQQQQQQQQPMQMHRNQSTHSLNQSQDDSAFKPSAEAQSQAPSLTPAEVAEKKQKSRMTFHWPKKAVKEESPAQVPPAGAASSSNKDASGTAPPAGNNQDSSRLRNFLGKGSSNNNQAMQSGQNGAYGNTAPIRQVFGVTLEQAIDQARIQPGYELPAVVYRCIEYLNVHKAKLEEGIYRLNGSSAVIKSLKERFNHDGDVALLATDEYYDIHAVAGLLKLFLRDLPSSVLTRELHKDFLQVIELPSRGDRVNELTRLVACLPEANYTLLRALTAHLIEIVDNADVNKMTARNVGIVFSPTLGIPAGVFALLMSDFDKIFHTHDGRIMPLENSDMNGLNRADAGASADAMMMA